MDQAISISPSNYVLNYMKSKEKTSPVWWSGQETLQRRLLTNLKSVCKNIKPIYFF